ncbi:basic proline-rich protein-like [Herpailurus yagouaroundi]|uniref:basic proline-rich protein-like n=1 Tax=Herpailurus yagouaroundi TaxID=1608482 RepID=UPI001AD6651C|nr:basic proline-rich protein-like [Puma yagouaroundi]
MAAAAALAMRPGRPGDALRRLRLRPAPPPPGPRPTRGHAPCRPGSPEAVSSPVPTARAPPVPRPPRPPGPVGVTCGLAPRPANPAPEAGPAEECAAAGPARGDSRPGALGSTRGRSRPRTPTLPALRRLVPPLEGSRRTPPRALGTLPGDTVRWPCPAGLVSHLPLTPHPPAGRAWREPSLAHLGRAYPESSPGTKTRGVVSMESANVTLCGPGAHPADWPPQGCGRCGHAVEPSPVGVVGGVGDLPPPPPRGNETQRLRGRPASKRPSRCPSVHRAQTLTPTPATACCATHHGQPAGPESRPTAPGAQPPSPAPRSAQTPKGRSQPGARPPGALPAGGPSRRGALSRGPDLQGRPVPQALSQPGPFLQGRSQPGARPAGVLSAGGLTSRGGLSPRGSPSRDPSSRGSPSRGPVPQGRSQPGARPPGALPAGVRPPGALPAGAPSPRGAPSRGPDLQGLSQPGARPPGALPDGAPSPRGAPSRGEAGPRADNGWTGCRLLGRREEQAGALALSRPQLRLLLKEQTDTPRPSPVAAEGPPGDPETPLAVKRVRRSNGPGKRSLPPRTGCKSPKDNTGKA